MQTETSQTTQNHFSPSKPVKLVKSQWTAALNSTILKWAVTEPTKTTSEQATHGSIQSKPLSESIKTRPKPVLNGHQQFTASPDQFYAQFTPFHIQLKRGPIQLQQVQKLPKPVLNWPKDFSPIPFQNQNENYKSVVNKTW